MPRPKGTPNIKELAMSTPSRCQKCGSTERTAYQNQTEVATGGVTSTGEAYTHVVWRTTRCKVCDQTRRDKSFENRVEPSETEK